MGRKPKPWGHIRAEEIESALRKKWGDGWNLLPAHTRTAYREAAILNLVLTQQSAEIEPARQLILDVLAFVSVS